MTRQEFNSYLDDLTSETGFDLSKEQKAFAYQAAKEYHNQALRIHDVSGCFSSSEYNMLRNNKGKQKAYVKGWKAAENGLSPRDCPYQPKIKDLVPTDPYFKGWHSGYESFFNNR